MSTPRILGAGGPAVFPVGLGCMGMSEFYGTSDDAESLRTLDRALDLGIDFFDTADTYGFGHNEALLGQWLRAGGPARRQRTMIASKFGIVRQPGQYERRIDNSPAYIRQACEASLRRLGVERIDLYYCHRRDPAVPVEEVVGALGELLVAGKIARIGFSEISAATLRRACAEHPVAAVQSEYSLWSREPEREMLSACTELGVTFVAYSPLGRAFLTGTVEPEKLQAGDFRRSNPRFQGCAEESNRRLVEALRIFSSKRGLSNAQVALAWLLSRHRHVIPIPGTRRISYLEQNAAAAGLVLAPDELTELDVLFAPSKVSGQRYPAAGMAGIE